MAKKPKIRFYLVHEETGQRYPVSSEDLVIGRSSGDLLFPEDASLSKQHCRIFTGEEGLSVHDLSSQGGTSLDGQRLDPNKVYPLRAGSYLKIGDQGFHLREASVAKRVSKRKSQPPPDHLSQFMLVVLLSLVVIALSQQVLKIRPAPQAASPLPAGGTMVSPYEMVDKEVRGVFDQYTQLGRDHEEGRLSQPQLAWALRNSLLPALTQVQGKLGVVTAPNETEKRRLEVNRKLVTALIGQVTAMADAASGKNPKAQEALQRYGQEVEALSQQAQALKNRMPAQSPPAQK